MALSRACCTISWLFSSKAEVASSNIRMRGFRIRALAIATLCFYPPDSLLPRNPHSFSNPG